MKFELKIESSNAAVVGEGAEQTVADMLTHAAEQVRDGFTSGYLRDGSNGGAIGHWEYTPERDEYPDKPDIEPERLAELRAAWDAEEISYGELAEIDAAFEQIDPATLSDLPENAMAGDKLDELEARLDMVRLTLRIENTYELYPDEVTTPTVTVPAPPPDEDSEDYDAWKYLFIHDATGVGHEDGDSWHDVEVTASSRPDLIPVGKTWDFGY